MKMTSKPFNQNVYREALWQITELLYEKLI